MWHCQGLSRTLIPIIFGSEVRKLVDVSDKWLLKVSSQHGPIYRFLEDYEKPILRKIFQIILKLIVPIVSLNTISNKYKLSFHNSIGYFTSCWNKQLHEKQISSCEKFKVINTGIDNKVFPYQKKENISTPCRLLFVGRISEEKGFIVLLKHLRTFMMKSIKYEAKVVGEFSDKIAENKIKTLINEYKLPNIIFEGKQSRDELFKYYHKAHFTIFPSICDEAFSRIPLESLMCGTPCLSTENPGSKELFEQDVPLIKLETESESLINAILPYLENNQLYKKLSHKGYEIVRNQFTFQRYMDEVDLMLSETQIQNEK